MIAFADGSGRLDRVRRPPMSRRPSPGGLPLSGHLALRHAEAEMLHDQDETLDLLAQAACPDEGPRHQRRRVAGLTLQRPSNMLRFARRLRLGQPPLRHECFRKKSIRRGFADGRCRPNAFTTVETSSNDGATTCINARLGDTRCSIGMRPIFRQVGKNRRRMSTPHIRFARALLPQGEVLDRGLGPAGALPPPRLRKPARIR